MITENNYEEYFLLYIDNELSEAEHNAVDAFVLQHPQHATLLQMFLETKLPDEQVAFTHKSSLYKQTDNEISIDNYETYFLLYTDNELSEKEKLQTERFVLQHPQLQEEFTLLQQTKLTAETIIFPNKERLYKKEKRVLPLYIQQITIAATICVIIASAWLLVPHQTSKISQVAANVSKTQLVQPKQHKIFPKTSSQKSVTEARKETALQSKPESVVNASLTNHTQIQKKKLDEKMTPVVIQSNNKTQQEPEEITVVQKEVKPQTIEPAEVLKPLVEISNEPLNIQTALEVTDENIAKPAVYKEINTDEDNHTLYVGSLQLNKAKVNGFLKTASRLFGSKAKQNIE